MPCRSVGRKSEAPGPSSAPYLKPYAYNAVLFKKNPSFTAPGKIFVSANPETGRPLGLAPLASPPTKQTHLDAHRLLSMIGDDQARERAQLAIKKVTRFVESPKGKEFPADQHDLSVV